jgi:hypothetical protein
VPFPTEHDAEIVHNTLVVDAELSSNTTRELRVEGAVLHVLFTAKEARHLRACLVRASPAPVLIAPTRYFTGLLILQFCVALPSLPHVPADTVVWQTEVVEFMKVLIDT